uniref:Neur_chan_LBD domain-containing protein n=1 Tax=Meloidogyne hapla TaxID=6305 RepID=A0A1I8AWE1_MELHA
MFCSKILPSFLLVIFQFVINPLATEAWISENRRIEQEILRNYDKRHRPVKVESTVVRVQLFLTVNHIEKVDEHEGTMLLHGILWAAWTDEYLRWSPTEHNNTFVISMEAWKIWQPTFALYNSARSNSWFVYMNGVPATVSNDGRVFAAGAFSFQVTCQFNFAEYPYDIQECPIVIAEWMYDLSKVNLSEAVSGRSGLNSLAKPAIRLSFDPLSENVKRHVAGWEVLDTWQRLCYWGPNGYCVDISPIGPLDNYWSLIEFGIRIKRHAPYYGLTLVLPIVITIILTLFVFWLDSLPMAIFLCLFNLFLESVCGLNLLLQLPPGDGIMPTIGTVHCWNFMLTLLALCLHCIFHFLITILLPETKCLPERMKNFTSLLKRYQAKELFVLSFDPQTLGSNNENEFSPSIPFEDTSELNQSPQQFIIEMDPIIIETESSNQSMLQQQPSTSAQFEAVELEEIPQHQQKIIITTTETPPATQSTLKRVSNSKKSLLSFGSGVFRSKEIKNEKRIDAPFMGITLDNEEKKLENGEKEDDKQILINEKSLNNNEERRKNISKEFLEEKKEKSPLEKELGLIQKHFFFSKYSGGIKKQ